MREERTLRGSAEIGPFAARRVIDATSPRFVTPLLHLSAARLLPNRTPRHH